jgi:formylglycine-generating enzyme required for sulfatase activity
MKLAVAGLVVSLVAWPQTWRNPADGMRFVRVPAVRDVPEFRMAETETTVEQFARFVKMTGYITEAEREGNRYTWKKPGIATGPDHPAVYMSLADALAYAQWAGVSLPTETEWLHAARAGSATTFAWGEDIDDRYVWHRENSPAGTQPVKTSKPNAWGLYDMIGNAWEWCLIDPGDGNRCDYGVIRGSSWTRCPKYQMRSLEVVEPIRLDILQPPQRNCEPPRRYSAWDDDRGFRCFRRVTLAAR